MQGKGARKVQRLKRVKGQYPPPASGILMGAMPPPPLLEGLWAGRKTMGKPCRAMCWAVGRGGRSIVLNALGRAVL